MHQMSLHILHYPNYIKSTKESLDEQMNIFMRQIKWPTLKKKKAKSELNLPHSQVKSTCFNLNFLVLHNMTCIHYMEILPSEMSVSTKLSLQLRKATQGLPNASTIIAKLYSYQGLRTTFTRNNWITKCNRICRSFPRIAITIQSFKVTHDLL